VDARALWVLGISAGVAAIAGGVAYAVSKQASPAAGPTVPAPTNVQNPSATTPTTPVSSTPAVPTPTNIQTPTSVTPAQGDQTVNLDVNTPNVALTMMAGSNLTFSAPSGGSVNTVNGQGLYGYQTFQIPGSELSKGSYTYTVGWTPTQGTQQFGYTTTVKVTVV
jgi:hypothetical protein